MDTPQPPKPHNSFNLVTAAIEAVAAVAAVYFAQPEFLGLLGVVGGTVAVGSVAAATSVAVATTISYAAAGGLADAVVQGIAITTGDQNGFSFNQMLESAVLTGVAAGALSSFGLTPVSSMKDLTPVLTNAFKVAISVTASQLTKMAAGWSNQFDFGAVMSAAMASFVNIPLQSMNKYAAGAVNTLAQGIVTSVLDHRPLNMESLAASYAGVASGITAKNIAGEFSQTSAGQSVTLDENADTAATQLFSDSRSYRSAAAKASASMAAQASANAIAGAAAQQLSQESIFGSDDTLTMLGDEAAGEIITPGAQANATQSASGSAAKAATGKSGAGKSAPVTAAAKYSPRFFSSQDQAASAAASPAAEASSPDLSATVMPDSFETGIMQGLGSNGTGISPLFYGSSAVSSGVVASQEYGIDVSNWMNVAVPQQQMRSDFGVGFEGESIGSMQPSAASTNQNVNPPSQNKSVSRFTMFGTGSGNVPSALEAIPIAGPAAEMAAEVFPGMMPDFVTAGESVSIPLVGNFLSINGQITLDSFGRLYLSGGISGGMSGTKYSYNAAMGWINQTNIPTMNQSLSFLTGPSMTYGGGVTGPYAAEQFASDMSATMIGIGTPQIGVTSSYTWEILDVDLHWRNGI